MTLTQKQDTPTADGHKILRYPYEGIHRISIIQGYSKFIVMLDFVYEQ